MMLDHGTYRGAGDGVSTECVASDSAGSSTLQLAVMFHGSLRPLCEHCRSR